MTQKEAKEYVENTANWDLIEETDHMRLYVLKVKMLTFYRVDLRVVANWAEYHIHHADSKADFRPAQYYDCLEGEMAYSIRPTTIADQIWKASK